MKLEKPRPRFRGPSIVQDILCGVRTARGATAAKRHVLLTAPHGACLNFPQDDPCTDTIARNLARSVTQVLKIPCACFVATTSRTEYDQNRLYSLSPLREVALGVCKLHHDRRTFEDVLHIDIHSYTAGGPLPPGWGKGINILHLLGDASQRDMADRLKAVIDPLLSRHLAPATVVEHPRLPTHGHDQDSNAMIELARHFGATSVIIEVPTTWHRAENVYKLACPEQDLVHSLTMAIRSMTCR